MRLRSLAFLASHVALFATAACGGHVDSLGDPGPLGPKASPNHLLFLQVDPQGTGGVERLVDVDLDAASVTPFSTPIPGTTASDKVEISRSGDRLLAVVAGTTESSAFAFDAQPGGLGTWREIARAKSLVMRASQDLRLLGFYAGAGQGPGTMRVVTYAGTTVVDGTRAPTGSGGVEFPRIEALSPAGRWAVVRMNKQEIELHEVSEQGVVGAVHTLARPEADGEISPSVRCGLPTSLILEGDFPAATWVDTTLAPIDVPGFLGSSQAVPVADWGSPCVFQDQETNGHHTLSSLLDRKVEPLFDYSGDALLMLTDNAYLQIDTASRSAKLVARSGGATLATYTPTPGSVAPPSYGTPQADISLTLASGTHDPHAFVWTVQRYAVDGDAMQSLELDTELWVVGQKTPHRLYTADETDTTTVALPPAYRFTGDGSRLVWIEAGKVHVLSVDSSQEKTLDPTGFVDGKIADGT